MLIFYFFMHSLVRVLPFNKLANALVEIRIYSWNECVIERIVYDVSGIFAREIESDWRKRQADFSLLFGFTRKIWRSNFNFQSNRTFEDGEFTKS